MRGSEKCRRLRSYVAIEERIPADHPPGPIRCLVDETLAPLSSRIEGLHSLMGRLSITPEMLPAGRQTSKTAEYSRSAPSAAALIASKNTPAEASHATGAATAIERLASIDTILCGKASVEMSVGVDQGEFARTLRTERRWGVR